ncbi:MAG: ABC transporter permease, partial [Lachnospiraceae bacterium]
MDNYKQLALRYLKLNRNRSIITVIGTAITVTVLFALLNLGWSAVLNLRTNLRQEQDYEVVFMTETKEQIDLIIRDDRIKSASVGSYYHYDYYNPVTYDNALFVNFNNPYNMDKLAKEFGNKSGVEFEYNDILAVTYLQGGEDFLGVIVCCLILLVSFVFAIFGVGIVRNSIQLCTLEQIKDYGNLRCIGSTKSQLKSIIYLEGAILEVTGMIIGILTGTLVSAIVGYILEIKAGFHFLPVVPVCIAFLGDLYFVMEENCKVVSNMTPVSA